MSSKSLKNLFLSSKSRLIRKFSSSSSQNINNTKNNLLSKSSFVSKLGIVIGLGTLPIAGFFVFDRFAPLPAELQNLKFNLPARFYIRRALCFSSSISDKAKFLDLAMQKVLASGVGSASPESTALVLYLARLYLEAPNTNMSDLEAAHFALIFKPHVGEAVKEEKARLELSLKVADRLCAFYSSPPHTDTEKVHHYASKSLEFIDNGPAYLHSAFANHPLKESFKKYKQ